MENKFLDVIASIVLGAVVLLISFTVGVTILYIVCILVSNIHISWNVDLKPIFSFLLSFAISLAFSYVAYDIGNDLLWSYKRKRKFKK